MSVGNGHESPDSLRTLILVCALLVSGSGLVALAGWGAGLPFLTTFGTGRIPMAPSTALLFLLSGLAAPFLVRLPASGRLERRASVAVAAAATLAALLLAVLSSLGIHPAAEHLGMDIRGTVGGAPVGHISPLTAVSFVLAGLSFLAGQRVSPGRSLAIALAFGSATLISLIAFILLLAYLLGAPLLYDSGVIPPALTTSLAFLFLGLSLQLAVGARARSSGDAVGPDGIRAAWIFGLVFVFLGTGIVAAGYLAFREQERDYRAAIEQQLVAIVALKTVGIAEWLSEQQARGEELAANRGFVLRVGRWLDHGIGEEREIVVSRLSTQFSARDYEGAMLLDRSGRPVWTQGEPTIPRDVLAALVERAWAGAEISRSDLYRNDTGEIYLTWAVPVRSHEPDDGRPLATVLFSIAAERFLFPFLRNWPTPSLSAETLLVRRYGSDVLFLNDLRFREDAALRLRVPLHEETIPAVQAVLGRAGIVDGPDYRGVPVVAALAAVPRSAWFMVARMDKAEIYAPLRERLWMMVFLLVSLLVGAGAAVTSIWFRMRHAQHLALMRAAAEKDREYAHELELRVAERTAALEAINREMEAFVYSVSHDLKAPLRGIDGYSRLLMEDYADRLDGEGRTFLANVRQGALQMDDLIEDLLAYSRAERRPLQSERVDVPQLVRAIVAERDAEIREHGAEVSIEVPECAAHADPEGLSMVLRNLIDNALKFTRDAPRPVIEIGGGHADGRCRLWVRDNGIGFDMKYHDRIFEIFQRLQRVEDFPGTGIGLAIVRKAMERMGGRVWAESTPGEGATFFLELPA